MIKRENIDSSPAVSRAVRMYNLDLSSMNAGILNYQPIVTGVKGNPNIGYTLTIEDRYEMIPCMSMYIFKECGEIRRKWNAVMPFNSVYNTKPCLLMYLYGSDKDVFRKAAKVAMDFMEENELIENAGRGYRFTDSVDELSLPPETEKYTSRTKTREPLKPQRTRAQTMPKISTKSIFKKKKTTRRK